MPTYPVIMCGGGGTRLWPASTKACPKQFIALVGSRSTFQETALRVAALEEVAELVIVANQSHAELIEAQLRDVGLGGVLLLEPEARDSGPAIAAAAGWIAERDPDGVAVIVASDHHLPDVGAFAAAVRSASEAARRGRIVTLGIVPTVASTAYGYIKPGAPDGETLTVEAFVEKPDALTAERHVAAGYLWNSGNFIATAQTLVAAFEESRTGMIPVVMEALRAARRTPGRVVLGEAFAGAPKISFDFAVMEATARASVVPVAFEWSDLGAWSAVRAILPLDPDGNAVSGDVVVVDTTGCLVRTDGPRVAAVGLRDLAVVVENGAVLVCNLAADQSVKSISDHFVAADARRAPPVVEPSTVRAMLASLDLWLRGSALPVWWTLGADLEEGGFHETLDRDGFPSAAPRRIRVQARQGWSFAKAGLSGWPGPWRAAVTHAMTALETRFRRADGLYRQIADAAPDTASGEAWLYDQAFVLLFLSAAASAASDPAPLIEHASRLRQALAVFRAPTGGFRESGPHPFQSNGQMHLLEACLAWMRVDAAGAGPWRDLAAEIVNLATRRMIQPERGVMPEIFDADWRPAPGGDGDVVEPGHQFEWAWLLNEWTRLEGNVDRVVIRRLYAAGRAGLDPDRGVVVNRMSNRFEVIDADARLWPQTEHLRGALMMWEIEGDAEYLAHAVQAATALSGYLATPIPGLWRDLRRADGGFIDEPSPASALYHLMVVLSGGAA